MKLENMPVLLRLRICDDCGIVAIDKLALSSKDLNQLDENLNSVEDLIRTGKTYALPESKISEALHRFYEARIRRNTHNRKKAAIIVVNSDYSKSRYESLPGTKEDMKLACGHGTHRTLVEKGKLPDESEEEANFDPRGQLGDCMVNTAGSLCSELELSYWVAKELKKDTKMVFFFDMCRNMDRDAGAKHKKEFVRINVDAKKEMEENGARILKIYSAKLGKKAKDFNSLFQRICHEIKKNSPKGMKLAEISRTDQDCTIKSDGLGWDEVLWPLL